MPYIVGVYEPDSGSGGQKQEGCGRPPTGTLERRKKIVHVLSRVGDEARVRARPAHGKQGRNQEGLGM
ncbi:MAG: hypothetical protein J0L92_40815 [Deltaproteobacteria bacterium]|nr:hypothetical protein [Deltaproteobacteria bacterium]